jgi:serine/threonine protein kinase
MLKEISKMRPHDHVVTHISSFTHDTKFYMLFPLADCNLGDYLDEQTPPSTDRDFVLWLIKQMKGLASAVCYLHRAGKDIVQDAFENKLPLVPSRERTCFHHDLKPENVLVFEDEKTGEKVLKISDFGSGRIGKPRTGMKGSYATKDPNTGTPDYEAPDWLLSEKSSRPYDIWSLGCLSLEMLLWAFRLRSRHDFESARFAYRDDELGIGNSPRFWYADAQRRAHLKPAVSDSLRTLGRHCEHYGVFGAVYKTIRGMFTISPVDRPKARDVEDDFDAICTQAERDVETDWNFYLTPGQNSTGVAAPVSAVASQPSRSRSPSAEPGSNRFDTDLLSPRSAQRANGLRGRAESLPNQEVLQQIGAQRHITFLETEVITGGEPTPHGSPLLRTEQVPEVLISDSSLATHDTPFGTVLRDLGSPWSSMQEEVRARLSGSVFEPPEKRR